jgi:hypothetical protein
MQGVLLMPAEKITSRKLGTLLIRLAMLLVVWGLVVHFAVRTVVTFAQYRAVSRELAQASAQYDRMFSEYSEQLWVGDRLANDRTYQRQILKDSYYYYEPDEQPLIIVNQ